MRTPGPPQSWRASLGICTTIFCGVLRVAGSGGIFPCCCPLEHSGRLHCCRRVRGAWVGTCLAPPAGVAVLAADRGRALAGACCQEAVL